MIDHLFITSRDSKYRVRVLQGNNDETVNGTIIVKDSDVLKVYSGRAIKSLI